MYKIDCVEYTEVCNKKVAVVYATREYIKSIAWISLKLEGIGDIKYQKEYVGCNFAKEKLTKIANVPKSIINLDADYIIVISDSRDLTHELLHAKYYLDSGYAKKVNKKWSKLPAKEKQKISRRLTSLGYAEHVHVDEWQAYEGKIP